MKEMEVEVSLEVGISLQSDNKSPTIDGDDNCLQVFFPFHEPFAKNINLIQG
jgi:hypothetical protein